MKSFATLMIMCALALFVGCTQDVDPLIKQANSLSDRGDLDSALTIFNLAISEEPTSARAFNGRGLVRKLLGDTTGALADYTKAIELDSNYQSAYNNRGVLRDCLGDSEGALSDFDHALQGNEKDHLALFNRAGARIHASDYAGALEDLKSLRSLGVVDKYPRVFYQEGYAYANIDSFELAEQRFNKYMTLDPSGCSINECIVNRGINRLNLDMFDSAYADLKRAEELGDRSFEVFYQQGFALTELKQWQKALEAYDLALELDSTEHWALWNSGRCKEALGDKEGACAFYRKSIRLGHKDPDGTVDRLCLKQ